MEHPQQVVEAIIALASTGLTRARIAEQIGGLSRSAVCGILWRAGFVPPAPPVEKRVKAPAKPRRKKPVQAKVPVAVRAPVNVTGLGVSWCDLDTTRCCTWPLPGDDAWCGKAKTDGSYCAGHFALAYRRAAWRLGLGRS